MSDRRRLLFVVPGMGIGGVSRSLITLLQKIPMERYDVTLLLFSKKEELLSEVSPQVHVEYAAYGQKEERLRGGVSTLLQRPCFRWLFRVAKKIYHRFGSSFTIGKDETTKAWDVAVAYQDGMTTWFVARNVQAVRKIAFIHTDFDSANYNAARERGIYQTFSQICICSEASRKKFLHALPEFEGKTVVVPNAIDSNHLLKLAGIGTGFKDSFNGLRLLTVGRLSREKGVSKIPELVRRLRENDFEFRWYLIGDGPERAALEKYAKVCPEMVLLGEVINPYPYVKQCDIYVQPSDFEGYCIALAEARVFCRPSVVCDFSGAEEQVCNGKTGLITGFGTDELYQGIVRLAENPSLRKTVEDNLRKERRDTNGPLKRWVGTL